MKLSKKILAALSAAALLATTALFSSCSDDEDDDDKNGTAYVTLPESVGENPLIRKDVAIYIYRRRRRGVQVVDVHRQDSDIY